MTRIYLDNNATTPPCPEAVQAVVLYSTDCWANPGSSHTDGRAAREGLDDARAKTARCLGCEPDEVVFTASGTESDVMAVLGVARARRAETGAARVVSTAVEHPAVLAALRVLEGEGFAVTRAPVDGDGLPDVAAMTDAIDGDCALVTLMLANNETGAVLPVAEVAAAARAAGVPCHTDAVNACGKVPCRVDELGVDLLSISAHKFHGPRGVGALVLRRGTPFTPLIVGGGHESGRRCGTENVAGIAGLAAALECACAELDEAGARMREGAGRLLDGVMRLAPDVLLNGPTAAERRLPNTLNLSFPGRSGAELAAALDRARVSVSTGAACHDGGGGERIGSHVMEAMGFDVARARGAIRVSLSRLTTPDEIDGALTAFATALG